MKRAARWFGIVAAAALASVVPARAAFRVEPGPATMTEEERSLAPDPARGMQHGVILLEESERDDPISGYARTAFHLRAKVLSNEARGLADVEIPFEAKRGYLRKWWGRTIRPDGTVLELDEAELREQTVIRSQGLEVRVLRAALPGVEPGCVIDYGYIFQDRSFEYSRKVPLQREWPIKRFRYRWLPSADLIAQYFIRRTSAIGLAPEGEALEGSPEPGAAEMAPRVRALRERQAIVVEGWNLPAFEREPEMPPEDLVRAYVLFHYVEFGLDVSSSEKFWQSFADRTRRRLDEFLDDRALIQKTLAGMGIPPEAELEEKLQTAHDWITTNVRNEMDKSSEEREAEAEESERERRRESRASTILETREGLPHEIDYLFIGFARALGARANLVLAPSRDSGIWDRELMFSGQLSARAVALVPESPKAKVTYTDPCSGLRYGEIPWQMTPAIGIMITEEGLVEAVLPASDPRQNVLHTQAAISWDEEGEAQVRWSAVGGGQRNSSTFRMLRRSKPHEREERLASLCGASSRLEISRAAAPGMDDPLGAFQIECEGSLTEAGLDPASHAFSLEFDGTWIPLTPSFTEESRVHPVVFDYPYINTSVVDVEAPEGYELAEVPAPVKISTPHTSYALSIARTPGGCRVQRAFAVVKTTVPQESYAGLRAFLQEVERADRSRLTFQRKRGESE